MSDVVLMAGPGQSSNIVYHRLASQFGEISAIVESSSPTRTRIAARRKKVGFLSLASQIAFLTLIRPLIERASRKRIEQICDQNALVRAPIPEAAMTRVESVNSPDCIAQLQSLEPKVVVINGTRIIRSNVLSCVSAVFFNTHAGITPHYRGAHGAYWALVQNDKKHCGVTVHIVDEGIDTGQIVGQAIISPTSRDTFATYPFLQIAAGLPLLTEAVSAALSGDLATRAAVGPSAVWYHPGAFQYLSGMMRGVR